MESKDVNQFGLIIVQSLGEGDIKTGDILHEEIIKYKKFEEPNLHSEIHYVNCKVELFAFLDQLNERIKVEGLFPILHLETHGYDDGIQLRSGEKVPWSEIMPYLRKINISLGNQLIAVLAVCVGISILAAIMPDERAPFRAMIGAIKDVSQIDMRDGFEHFYDKYFFEFDFEASLDALNVAIGQKKPLFYVLPADYVFDQLVNPDRDPAFFKRMVDEHAVEAKATHPQLKRFGFTAVRMIIERKIRRMFSNVAKEKGYFMMRDIE